jgi:hypothetical protein
LRRMVLPGGLTPLADTNELGLWQLAADTARGLPPSGTGVINVQSERRGSVCVHPGPGPSASRCSPSPAEQGVPTVNGLRK